MNNSSNIATKCRKKPIALTIIKRKLAEIKTAIFVSKEFLNNLYTTLLSNKAKYIYVQTPNK